MPETKRYNWIDWVKVLGMLFIIWGHSSPTLMSDFVYTFNVGLFFVVSGYLGHRKQEDFKISLKRIYSTLIVPYCLLCGINLILLSVWFYIQGNLTVGLFANGLFANIVGLQGLHFSGFGCGPLWFVYTLIIIKVLCLFCSNKVLIVLSTLGILAAYILKSFGFNLDWAVSNTLLALPCFTVGLIASNYRDIIGKWQTKVQFMPILPYLLLIISLVVLTYYISTLNGSVKMFMCDYGNNPILFLLGSLVGTAVIVVFSMRLEKYDKNSVSTISRGTIIILAFHFQIIRLFSIVINKFSFDPLGTDLLKLLASLLCLLLFIPVICIIQKYIPQIMGGR